MAGGPPDGRNWHYDWSSRRDFHGWEMGEVLVTTRTQFQDVMICESPVLGRSLFLDGRIQSGQIDEWLYHEILVHPALTIHPDPRRVLVLGGGEGATLREILRHPTVERTVMVDIDGELIDFCRRHLPDWHEGAFDDPRTELVIADARQYLLDRGERFDVILGDLTDPTESGLASLLYSRQMYEVVRARLAEGGIFATQATGIRYGPADGVHASIHATLRRVFGRVASYGEFVPSFDALWAFILASDGPAPGDLDAAGIDRRLAERGIAGLRGYDGRAHERIFALPKYVRTLLAQDHEVIEEDHPIAVEW